VTVGLDRSDQMYVQKEEVVEVDPSIEVRRLSREGRI
jgi:hypothetical protein